ncbi:MAG: hypothetical protein ACTHNS_11020 [Marmoricola sp.]
MTDEGPGPGPADPEGPVGPDAAGDPAGETVGSVGEEAAKLFAALTGAARDQDGPYGDAAAGVSSVLHGVREHLAAGANETTGTTGPSGTCGTTAACSWCPVCRVVHAVRQTSPEVRQQLAVAAGALAQAAAGLLATDVPSRRAQEQDRSGPVQRIDLDDDQEERADGSHEPR